MNTDDLQKRGEKLEQWLQKEEAGLEERRAALELAKEAIVEARKCLNIRDEAAGELEDAKRKHEHATAQCAEKEAKRKEHEIATIGLVQRQADLELTIVAQKDQKQELETQIAHGNETVGDLLSQIQQLTVTRDGLVTDRDNKQGEVDALAAHKDMLKRTIQIFAERQETYGDADKRKEVLKAVCEADEEVRTIFRTSSTTPIYYIAKKADGAADPSFVLE